MARASIRTIAVGQILLGGATSIWPSRVGAAVAGGSSAPPPAIVRILGARQFAQGAVCLVAPTPDAAFIASAVDAMHALSLIPIVAFSARFRRAALASLAAAAAAAVLEARAAAPT